MESFIADILENYSADDLGRLKLLITELECKKVQKCSSSSSLQGFKIEYEKHIKLNFSNSYLKSIKLSFDHLLKYAGCDRAITDITIKEAEGFKAFLMMSAPLGYKVYLRNMKAAFNKAADWEMVTANPFAKVKINQVQQVAPIFICRKELDAILEHTGSPIIRELFLFGFYTGCRLGEIVNLKWKHIDLNRKLLTVGDGDLHTKNKRTRTIPICEILYSKLVKPGFSENSDRYVFAKSNGFPFNRDYISRAFKKTVREVSLSEKIHFHTLRHSFASNLAIKGVPLIVIKELLGHSSIVTTQIYSHSDLDSLQKAVGKFDEAE